MRVTWVDRVLELPQGAMMTWVSGLSLSLLLIAAGCVLISVPLGAAKVGAVAAIVGAVSVVFLGVRFIRDLNAGVSDGDGPPLPRRQAIFVAVTSGAFLLTMLAVDVVMVVVTAIHATQR